MIHRLKGSANAALIQYLFATTVLGVWVYIVINSSIQEVGVDWTIHAIFGFVLSAVFPANFKRVSTAYRKLKGKE